MKSFGSNLRRWTEGFFFTAIEIDSARLTYDPATANLIMGQVGGLIMRDGLDSAKLNLVSSDVTLNKHFRPSLDSNYDLGTANFRWKDLYLSGNTIYMGDSATIKANGKGLDISLAVYDSAGVIPASRKQGHLVILATGDSNTGGPTLAFKDSDNGNYIRFSTSGFAGGGGGGF